MITETTLSCTAPSAQKKRRGFTLTEIAIVLGIVGLILGAVWAAAKNVYGNVGSAKATEVTSTLIAGVRGAFATQSPNAGDLSSAFQGYSYSDGTNTYNPRIEAGAATIGGNTVNGFVIQLDGNTVVVGGVTYGTALGVSSADQAICNGIQSAALQITSANVSNTLNNALNPVVGNCNAQGTCAVRGGYITNTSTCTPNAQNVCFYTQVGVCSPTGNNPAVNIAAFIPWQS